MADITKEKEVQAAAGLGNADDSQVLQGVTYSSENGFNRTGSYVPTAAAALYDNTKSGLDAENAQDAIDELKEELDTHQHTKEEVGLGNVPNVGTNDQTPTHTTASSLTALTSGEKLSLAFGKIAKAINSLISHLADAVSHITAAERTAWNNKLDASGTAVKATSDAKGNNIFNTYAQKTELTEHTGSKSNPHGVTKAQVGLGNVDNTADSAKSVKYAASAGIAEPKFNNGTLYDVGDDVAIGDQNVPGTLIVKGKNGDGAIEFRNPSGTKIGTAIHTGNIGSQSVNYANSAGSVAWGNVTGKPSTFTPSGHQHNASDIIGLPSGGGAEYGTFNLTLADGTIAFKGYNYVKIGKVVFFHGKKLALVEVPYYTKLYGFPFTISDTLSVVMSNYVSAPPPVSMTGATELTFYFESDNMYFLKDPDYEKFIVDRPLRIVGYYFTDD